VAEALRNLIVTGGMYHPFEDSAPALRDVLADVGIGSVVTDDMAQAWTLLASGAFDLLTVYALRWTMPQDKFAQDRVRWAHQVPTAARQALQQHLQAGKGVLALHTAAICFDDWPQWREAVGAGWIWGDSHHPPLGPVQVRPTGRAHPIVDGLDGFSLVDEAYTRMDLLPDLQPLMEVRADTQSSHSPCLWARAVGGGRVVYNALGHDRASLMHPVHQTILQRSALWAGLGVVSQHG
jgi:type 1 glutamine amidotransferase